MIDRLPTPLGALCVLDIESAPDPEALALLAERRRGSENASAMQKVVSASILRAAEGPGHTWEVSRITSLGVSNGLTGDEEEDVLLFVNKHLQQLGELGGLLVTYNGKGHDLTVLRRRLARNRLFEASGLLNPELRHLDLLHDCVHDGERWPKLKEIAAGMAIPISWRFPETSPVKPTQAKGEVDVCATFLVFLCQLGLQRQQPEPLYLGWRALGRYIRESAAAGEHLQQYARHLLGSSPPAVG